MARSERVNAAVVTACVFVAAACLFAAQIYRRRWRRQGSAGRQCCSKLEDKPQNHFKRVLVENSYKTFKHFRREGEEKEISLKMHPYEEEINFLLECPPMLMKFFSTHPNSDMGNSYLWINTEHQLESLAVTLSKEKVFAVDTEQHSLRSFLGFTALMQISTQKEDFLLDTIALHDVVGILRPVFEDPSICKVFHGADNDVIWLQRDFHIYVVNMFDTAKACEVLSKPQKSLAFLLETYCGVLTDKSLQREDWRQRPLSAEMIQYARTDAHYLLHIADCLVSELRAERLDATACPYDKFNFFFEASRRSNTVCLQLYVKESELSPGASAAASILSRNWSKEGVSTWKSTQTKDFIWKVCAWRDLVARIHDESLRYVLSDNAIVKLSIKVPKSPEKIFEVIKEADFSNGSQSNYPSLPSPSPVVRTHVDELCLLLQYHDTDISDVLKRHQQKHLDMTGCCPLSIYNYALLSEFTSQNLSSFSWKNGGKSTATGGRKASRELFVKKFSCKSPVYHNCRIYANDGRLLCYCDRRKLDWYLRRDLAKIVEEDPPAIMLLFEPKGRPEDEGNEFYIQSKKNICVGCGEKYHYLRYRIIPSCYRMHFPEHLKSHRSHDIVLLCVDCHERAHAAAEKHKRQIAEEFEIPLFVEKIADSGESNTIMVKQFPECGNGEKGVPPLQLRTAAMALLRHGSHMPSKRQDELMQVVKTYFGGREVLPEDLETALLVGMSPHERKRLEKKRGLAFRHNKGCDPRGNSSSPLIGSASKPKLDNIEYILEESLEDKGVREISLELRNISNHVSQGISLADEQTSTKSATQFDERKCYGTDEIAYSESNGNGVPEQQTAESSRNCKLEQDYSSRRANRLSLLGHGHHGKEVVERLLREHGEDGISQFCQKLRQVFVEAVNPRFLPLGWDIMHSGRRDFGEYSVYNPAKKMQPPENN